MQRRRGGMMRTMRVRGLIAGGLWLLAAGQAQAVESNGPYYAEPSWAQKLPAATRFVVLTDWASQAVLDRETGLVWERSPATTLHGWNSARLHCTSRTTGGRKGWRLPSVHELASLIDPSVAHPGPTLTPSHPFANVQSDFYWSATSDAGFPAFAWLVGFSDGLVGANDKRVSFRAWCVRGGHNDGSEY